MAALVQAAVRRHEQWLAEGRAAAQQTRAAAEDTLKRLNSQAA